MAGELIGASAAFRWVCIRIHRAGRRTGDTAALAAARQVDLHRRPTRPHPAAGSAAPGLHCMESGRRPRRSRTCSIKTPTPTPRAGRQRHACARRRTCLSIRASGTSVRPCDAPAPRARIAPRRGLRGIFVWTSIRPPRHSARRLGGDRSRPRSTPTASSARARQSPGITVGASQYCGTASNHPNRTREPWKRFPQRTHIALR